MTMDSTTQQGRGFFGEATLWKNPTGEVVRVHLPVGTGNVPPPDKPYARGQHHPDTQEVVWRPGETHAVPKIYDLAIKDESKPFVGLAPQLERVRAVKPSEILSVVRAEVGAPVDEDPVAAALENLDAPSDEPASDAPKGKRGKSSPS